MKSVPFSHSDLGRADCQIETLTRLARGSAIWTSGRLADNFGRQIRFWRSRHLFAENSIK